MGLVMGYDGTDASSNSIMGCFGVAMAIEGV